MAYVYLFGSTLSNSKEYVEQLETWKSEIKIALNSLPGNTCQHFFGIVSTLPGK